MRRCRRAGRPAARSAASGSNGSIGRRGQCRQDAVEPGQQRRRQRRHGLQHGAAVLDPPRAEQRQIAAGLQGRQRPGRPASPAQRLHGEIVAEQQALNARARRGWSGRSPRREVVAGPDRVEGGVDDVRGHGERQIAQARAPARSRSARSSASEASTTGSSRWLSTTRPAMPRQMLDHRRDPAGEQAVGEGARRASPPGSGRRRRSGCRWPRSCRRRRRRAPARSRCRCRPRADRGRSAGRAAGPPRLPASGSAAGEPADLARRRQGAPVRRAQAHHPAALLVDQHRQPASGRRGACSSSVRARSCARSAQLRWNRMTPAGGSASSSSRSAGVQHRCRRCRRRPRAGAAAPLTPASLARSARR